MHIFILLILEFYNKQHFVYINYNDSINFYGLDMLRYDCTNKALNDCSLMS